jgi:hypothetical protein
MADVNYSNYGGAPEGNPNDKKSIGFGILSFFIPLVGLILFIVWRKEMPKKAKSAGIGAIVGIVVWVIFWIVYYVTILMPAMNALSNASYY